MAKIKGVTEINIKIKNFQESRLGRVKTAIEMTQAKVVNEARSNHPYTDRSVNLTNSIQPGPVNVGRLVIQGEVQANMEYASFVEAGTSRSRPFPYLAPAILKSAGFFRRAIERALA
jgi:hypothetical protein